MIRALMILGKMATKTASSAAKKMPFRYCLRKTMCPNPMNRIEAIKTFFRPTASAGVG